MCSDAAEVSAMPAATHCMMTCSETKELMFYRCQSDRLVRIIQVPSWHVCQKSKSSMCQIGYVCEAIAIHKSECGMYQRYDGMCAAMPWGGPSWQVMLIVIQHVRESGESCISADR